MGPGRLVRGERYAGATHAHRLGKCVNGTLKRDIHQLDRFRGKQGVRKAWYPRRERVDLIITEKAAIVFNEV